MCVRTSLPKVSNPEQAGILYRLSEIHGLPVSSSLHSTAYGSAEEGRDEKKYPNRRSDFMPMRACVHLITNPGTARDVAVALSKIDGVISTDLTTGRFDIMVLVDKEDADLAWLQNTVLAKIRREQGVVRTETAICTEKFTRSR